MSPPLSPCTQITAVCVSACALGGSEEGLAGRFKVASSRQGRVAPRESRSSACRTEDWDRQPSAQIAVPRLWGEKQQERRQEPCTEREKETAQNNRRSEIPPLRQWPQRVSNDRSRAGSRGGAIIRGRSGRSLEGQQLREVCVRQQEGRGPGEGEAIGGNEMERNKEKFVPETGCEDETGARQRRQGPPGNWVVRPYGGQATGEQRWGKQVVEDRSSGRWSDGVQARQLVQGGQRAGGKSDRNWWRPISRGDYLDKNRGGKYDPQIVMQRAQTERREAGRDTRKIGKPTGHGNKNDNYEGGGACTG